MLEALLQMHIELKLNFTVHIDDYPFNDPSSEPNYLFLSFNQPRLRLWDAEALT
jgi:hypothetical protein